MGTREPSTSTVELLKRDGHGDRRFEENICKQIRSFVLELQVHERQPPDRISTRLWDLAFEVQYIAEQYSHQNAAIPLLDISTVEQSRTSDPAVASNSLFLGENRIPPADIDPLATVADTRLGQSAIICSSDG